jgi:hypothetical protein
MLLLLAACSDRLLTPVPRQEESKPDVSDSTPAGDSAANDTAPDSGGGESCGERTLGAAHGAPLARGEELDAASVTYFGIAIKPGVEAGAPRVWVQASLGGIRSTAPNAAWNGAYLLAADDWAAPVLPAAETPRLYSDRPTYEPQPWLHRSGLTTDAAYPGEASWFGNNEEDEGSVFLLFTHPPATSAVMADEAAATLTARYYMTDRAITADLDGDGLDDLLVPGWPIHVFLSPMAGALTEDDADHIFEMGLSDNFGWDPGGGHAAADLDGDGYMDLVWESSTRRWGDGNTDDVFYVRGPILTRASWEGADGVLLDDTPGDPISSNNAVRGEAGGIRAVGDLTGDGRDDVTVHSENDAYGRVGSSVLYVLDHPVVGTEELAEQPIRLVGLPTILNHGGQLGSGGSGDVNGDGLLDLVAFEHYTGLATGLEYRGYLVTGPIDGLIDLENDAVNIRLPADTDTSEAQAIIVPDLDADGLDDVVFSAWGGGEPGVVWLFPGCAGW